MRLELGDVENFAVSVAVVPYLSVLSLLTDAVGGLRRGAPPEWRRTIAQAVSAEYHDEVVRPMVAPGHSLVPDAVLPIAPRADTSVDTQLEYLGDADERVLLRDLDAVFGADVPPHWRPAAHRPGRWLDGYREASAQAWRVIAPLWRRVDGLLHREIDRIGAAVVRGCHTALLDDLTPRISCRDGAMLFPDSEPTTLPLGGRRLVLVPTVTGARSVITGFDEPDIVYVAYPLPGLGGAWSQPAPSAPGAAAEDVTELVLGQHRTLILRALDRPANMRGLAAALNYTPSALTYQCDRLVQAGLILRERRGREMLVSRTELGVALLDLLAGG